MSKLFFYKKNNGEAWRIHIARYIITLSLPVFIAVLAMLIGIEYFHGNGIHIKIDVFKIVTMISISAFFAVINSITSIYKDKFKIQKAIHDLKHRVNAVNFLDEQEFINAAINLSMPIEIINIAFHNGKLKKLEVQSISFTVSGMNMRKVKCSAYCFMLFHSGKSEFITLDYHSLNDGEINMREVIHPTKKKP